MQIKNKLPAATFNQYNGKIVSFQGRYMPASGRVVEGYVYNNETWLLIEQGDELVVMRAYQCELIVESNPAT